MENQLTDSSEERTFQYQNSLPSLPVPPLDESLTKYLDAGMYIMMLSLTRRLLLILSLEYGWGGN